MVTTPFLKVTGIPSGFMVKSGSVRIKIRGSERNREAKSWKGKTQVSKHESRKESTPFAGKQLRQQPIKEGRVLCMGAKKKHLNNVIGTKQDVKRGTWNEKSH
jgi:hypothetical protein